MRDQVYSEPQGHIVDFAFDSTVAGVFPDMIRRSVPGYETMVPMTGLIAARHLGDNGTAYDLGCSLGATSAAILRANPSPDIRVVGVDNAQAMVDQAKTMLDDPRLTFRYEDIRNTRVHGARVVVLNLVLQFLPPTDRLPLLTRLGSEMAPDGLLLVSEKVTHSDPHLADYYVSTHEAWKQANGYSALEVSQKRTALENVMRIDTEATHIQRFKDAGFKRVIQWYRCMNWASFIVHLNSP